MKEDIKKIEQALYLAMRQRKSGANRFKLTFDKVAIVNFLRVAYRVEVESRMRDYEEDDSTKQHIDKMAEWLGGESNKFGMMLCGGCGNGKTTMVLAVQTLISYLVSEGFYGRIGLRIVKAKDIGRLMLTDVAAYNAIEQTDLLAIDDLGLEATEVMHYGNVINPAVDLLTARYESMKMTIITTNLKPSDIRAKYGDRIADRLNEMMDRIVFTNPTYRM